MSKVKGLFGPLIVLWGLFLFPFALIILPAGWLLGAIFYKKGFRVDNGGSFKVHK